MTKPTQAQIETAADAIKKYMGVFTNPEEIAKAALTAAAEVCPYCSERAVMGAFECRCSGLTAAAEVGVKPTETRVRPDMERAAALAYIANSNERYKINATIERCAQVAADYSFKAAAAIRALKEKP